MSGFDPSNVDVEHFLDTLGIENIHRATHSEMRFSCPFPNHAGGDETPSCYMNLNTSAFFCHGCKERGTAVDFAAYVLSISPLEAIRILRQAYQPGAIDPDMRDMQAEVQKILSGQGERIEQPLLDDEIAQRFEMNWHEAYAAYLCGQGFEPCDYFFERGFNDKTLAEWGFGFDVMSGRVVFPIRDEHDRLIGFKGRAHWADAKPKYLVLGDGPNGGRYNFPRYYPSHVVFGAHRVRHLDQQRPLIVCEGELNAISIWQKTNYQAVAINGSFFSGWHARVIREIAPEAGIVLFLDDDAAGQNAVWGWENSRGEWHPGAVELLSPHLSVQITREHERDAADMEPSEVEGLLASAESWLAACMRS